MARMGALVGVEVILCPCFICSQVVIQLSQGGLILVQMIGQDESIITTWQVVQDYVKRQLLIKMHIKPNKAIRISLHPFHVTANRLSLFHFSCYEGLYHLVLF